MGSRTFRLSAPLITGLPVFGSMRSSSPQRAPSRGSRLVAAFRSPGTLMPCGLPIPGSTFPALPLRFPVDQLPGPFGFQLSRQPRFAPDRRPRHRSGPFPVPQPAVPAAPPVSTPLRDFYVPPDQSVLPGLPPVNPPSESARFPLAPHSRFLSLVFRLRIIVPGPLRFRRLAVPQRLR
jgi:hypothetical protein